jgi:hypothetical protein
MPTSRPARSGSRATSEILKLPVELIELDDGG